MSTVDSCSDTVNARRVDGHAALASLIQPLSASRFLEEYWNKQFAHVPGDGAGISIRAAAGHRQPAEPYQRKEHSRDDQPALDQAIAQ